MIRPILLAAAVLLTTPTLAQQGYVPTYTAPDRELWEAMQRALAEIPMSLSSHQQVQRILADVAREASVKKARPAAPAAPPGSEEQGK